MANDSLTLEGEFRRAERFLAQRNEARYELELALDAITEVMGYDKGPREDEWVRWANRWLPLVQKHGRAKGILEFT